MCLACSVRLRDFRKPPMNVPRRLSVSTAAAGVLIALLAGSSSSAADRVSFNRDVRPILSDKCFHCHGPDEKKRDSGLRLDVRAEAVKERDGIHAIVPGEPAASDLIVRITSTDRDEMMPPPKAKLGALTPAEAEIIKRWIAEGAEYEQHWSLMPPRPSDARDIDVLVERGLAARGLQGQPEADANTLIRRVTFDLTGLPPTPAEVEAFVKASIGNRQWALGNLVDRLLASPAFGERMAVDWLDISRYADSYGFQVDRERAVWPWRDWVIRAFNDNLPFDQFITWQLAGDLLPNATDDQVLATAFNRLHQQEAEGGSVEEEYRVEYVADRVQTFATAFLGLTFECARCHDHKFDPITQKDYYQLFSIFQNIDEAGLYSFFTNSPPTPTLEIADTPAKLRLAALQRKVTEAEQRLAAVRQKQNALVSWLASPRARVEVRGEIGGFGFETLEQGRLVNWMDDAKPATVKGENKLVPGRFGNAVEFTGDDPVDLPFGNFQRYEPFSVALWIKTPDVKERAVVFHRSRAWTDAASRGYELLIEEGKLKWSLIHFWPGNAISIRAERALPLNAWTHVVVTSDGSSRAAGLRVYVDGQLAPVEVIKDALTRDITGGGGDNIALGERFRDRGFKGGAIDEFRVFGRELTPAEVRATMDEAALIGKEALQEYFLVTTDGDYAKELAALQVARGELAKAVEGIEEIMVMRELAQPKKAFVLLRGQYDQRRDEVGPGTPSALAPWAPDAPKNRLGLAQWLTDPQHPLTARVIVNRFWQSIFGQGLVKTPEDFGSQGARPVYPEVLDLLALRFVQSGWNTKALIKSIVMSRTYRQRSFADAKTMADDPENELLARGPRFRLSAEMIRDNALAASGLLNPQIGGASVNPYEMSEAFKPQDPSGGPGLYRRSIYTKWRRTGPPPAMIAFDAPRRAVCVVKRERTDSPLQALILLNGTQFVEAARLLGEKLHREAAGDVAAMIEGAFLRCLSRPPDAREREIMQQLYAEQLAHFSSKPEEAAALLKVGSAPAPKDAPAAELAAAAVLAQTLLNHDASVVKR
ncbi:MAG: Planctomycete cytochrome [Chthoniobacter sp.]|nr:Planctomycete cytochrome [Chthoniobacter sp.]